MAQVYKMMLGTSGRQWELLTVKDDGTMTMYFHGTDRSVTQQVTAVTEGEWKGWLKSEKGSMWPGVESGRWTLVSGAEAEEATVAAKPQPTEQAATVAKTQPIVEEVVSELPQVEAVVAQPTPRPRRKRKPAAPRRDIETSRQRNIETQEPTTDNGWLRSAGYLAAASVALLVIWQTGLIIPLGLIGLATSGLLK